MDYRNKAVEPTSRGHIRQKLVPCKSYRNARLGMCLYMGQVKPQEFTDASKLKRIHNMIIDLMLGKCY